jgi:antitoxin (DNA-binding transcriptional repressor) of toxin-antitoxin stability system
MRVSVAGAKNEFPERIKAVEDAETLTICRRGVPAVDIKIHTGRAGILSRGYPGH